MTILYLFISRTAYVILTIVVIVFATACPPLLLLRGNPNSEVVNTPGVSNPKDSGASVSCVGDTISVAQIDIKNQSGFFSDTPNLSANYCLTEDITLPKTFSGIKGTFNGNFNGNNFSIIAISSFESGASGIFTVLGDRASISKLSVHLKDNILLDPEGTPVSGGILAGLNQGTISEVEILDKNPRADMSITAGKIGAFGGLVGINEGTITNAKATITVKGLKASEGVSAGDLNKLEDQKTGGLVGENRGFGTIERSSATGKVTGTNIVGGLVGQNTGTISKNSYAIGMITGTGKVGGLVGENTGTISQSSARGGNVGGNSNVGGLVGESIGTIGHSYATKEVYGNIRENINVGGLVGENTGTISHSYATGAVTGKTNIGGLLGNNKSEKSISKSYATGAVTGETNIGGLIGNNEKVKSISKSYATGTVTGAENFGGLIGVHSEGSIANVYATGNVLAARFDARSQGGLIGGNVGTIKYALATGTVGGAADINVTNTSNSGGLIGFTSGSGSKNNEISYTLATGSVQGAQKLGGLIGYSQRSVSNSGALGEIKPVGTVGERPGGLIGELYGSLLKLTTCFFNKKATNPVGKSVTNQPGARLIDVEKLAEATEFLKIFDDAGWDTDFWKEQVNNNNIPRLPKEIVNKLKN